MFFLSAHFSKLFTIILYYSVYLDVKLFGTWHTSTRHNTDQHEAWFLRKFQSSHVVSLQQKWLMPEADLPLTSTLMPGSSMRNPPRPLLFWTLLTSRRSAPRRSLPLCQEPVPALPCQNNHRNEQHVLGCSYMVPFGKPVQRRKWPSPFEQNDWWKQSQNKFLSHRAGW